MAVPKYVELKEMSDAEIITTFDKEVSPSYNATADYYLSELFRRSQDRQSAVMLKYTKWVTIMTVVITIATILNLILFIVVAVWGE